MKLTCDALVELFALRRRRLTHAAIAERLRLPVDVVAKACRHQSLIQGRRNVEAVHVPLTLRNGLWFCPACRATLEAAPCIACGGAREPRIVRRRREPIADAPGIRVINCRHPGRS